MDYTFLSENYVLIIVIAVIVIMTIVGYIADKTNFGEKKEKTPKEKKKKVVKEEPVENNEENMDSFMTNDVTPEEKAESTLDNSNDVSFDSFEPVAPLNDDHLESNEMNFEMPSDFPKQETVQNPVSDEITENESTQNETMDSSLENSISNENTNIDDSNVPSSDEKKTDVVEDHISEEPVSTEEMNVTEEPVSTEEVSTDNFALPSIDKLNQEIADVEDDEDVWKF